MIASSERSIDRTGGNVMVTILVKVFVYLVPSPPVEVRENAACALVRGVPGVDRDSCGQVYGGDYCMGPSEADHSSAHIDLAFPSSGIPLLVHSFEHFINYFKSHVPSYFLAFIGILCHGDENSMILLVKGHFNVSLNGLLRRMGLIRSRFPGSFRSSLRADKCPSMTLLLVLFWPEVTSLLTFKILYFLNYALMIRHDYDLTSSLRRGALQTWTTDGLVLRAYLMILLGTPVILDLMAGWSMLKKCSYIIFIDSPSYTCILWTKYPSFYASTMIASSERSIDRTGGNVKGTFIQSSSVIIDFLFWVCGVPGVDRDSCGQVYGGDYYMGPSKADHSSAPIDPAFPSSGIPFLIFGTGLEHSKSVQELFLQIFLVIDATGRQLIKPCPCLPIQRLLKHSAPHEDGPFSLVSYPSETAYMVLQITLSSMKYRRMGLIRSRFPGSFRSSLRADKCPSMTLLLVLFWPEVTSLLVLRSDKGGEYLSIEFFDHLKNYGIVLQLPPPRTPQLNGVAKRRNSTLLDMVRSMMNRATLLISFWGYALETAAYILNLVPSNKVSKTPFEMWKENVLLFGT
nr:retrotransposon protein, putative, Ty1-copia subclass [Tanacetum cinerariifolium]